MKLIFPLLISFVFSFDIVFAQNYNVVNPNRTALFANSDSSVFHSVKIDSVKVINGDTVYYNYGLFKNFSQATTDTNCMGWGSNGCIGDMSRPSWLGSSINRSAGGETIFLNITGDTLRFNFSALNDTSKFYQDLSQKFYIINKGIDTLSIFGFTDSIKIFEILHKDTFGNEINSNLNHKKITIGKELGLINFFNVDSFPAYSKTYSLKGITTPNLGLYKISTADVENYMPGDEIEYTQYSNGAPVRYVIDSIINRTENSDTIFYTSQHSEFCMNCQQQGLYFNQVITTFFSAKNDNLLRIPFETFEDNSTWLIKKSTTCYKGLELSYQSNPCIAYCAYSNCFTSADCAMFSYGYATYVTGVGLINTHQNPIQWSQNGSSKTLYYSNIAGKTCGTKYMIYPNPNSITLNNTNSFNLFPNPSSINITITAVNTNQIQTTTIFNTLGKVVWINKNISDKEINIDISHLSASIYFVEVVSEDGSIGRKRFIKE